MLYITMTLRFVTLQHPIFDFLPTFYLPLTFLSSPYIFFPAGLYLLPADDRMDFTIPHVILLILIRSRTPPSLAQSAIFRL